MFGQLNMLLISSVMAIVPYEDLAWMVVQHAKGFGADLALIPWLPLTMDEEQAILSLDQQHLSALMKLSSNNPFELLFIMVQISAGGIGGGGASSVCGLARSSAVIHLHRPRQMLDYLLIRVAVLVGLMIVMGQIDSICFCCSLGGCISKFHVSLKTLYTSSADFHRHLHTSTYLHSEDQRMEVCGGL